MIHGPSRTVRRPRTLFQGESTMGERFGSEVVLVTGGGAGIGRACARAFAAGGAKVAVAGRTREKLDAVVAEIEAEGGEALAAAADCGDEAGVETVVSAVEARFGAPTIVVNNAGVGWSFEGTWPGSMAAVDGADLAGWREVLRINLDSAFLVTHRVLPAMLAAGRGAIVNVSSAGGTRGMDDAHAYAASKAAMINLTRSLARTYGPRGVRANCLAPGFVATDMVAGVLAADDNPFADDATRFAVCPVGRPGEPEEMAEAVTFLAGNGYANGAVLVLDGGSTA
jgi:NAD(P)-dependent dehydrogenase (short-subunit alcohol dehydrogenase family)